MPGCCEIPSVGSSLPVVLAPQRLVLFLLSMSDGAGTLAKPIPGIMPSPLAAEQPTIQASWHAVLKHAPVLLMVYVSKHPAQFAGFCGVFCDCDACCDCRW